MKKHNFFAGPSILPDYTVSGVDGNPVVIHRSASPYFGMEINLHI